MMMQPLVDWIFHLIQAQYQNRGSSFLKLYSQEGEEKKQFNGLTSFICQFIS